MSHPYDTCSFFGVCDLNFISFLLPSLILSRSRLYMQCAYVFVCVGVRAYVKCAFHEINWALVYSVHWLEHLHCAVTQTRTVSFR